MRLAYGVMRNMNVKFDLKDVLYYQTVTGADENDRRSGLFENDTTTETVPESTTTSVIRTSTTFPKTLSGDDRRNEFQYYIIGVYSFFITLFAIGLLVIIAKKLQKACCTSSKRQRPAYDSVPSQTESLNAQDNPGFEHHVNVDPLDVERTRQENDSDYDYYSDDSNGETKRLKYKDRPPAYEAPPSYSVVLQT